MSYTNLNGKSPLKLSNGIEIVSGSEDGLLEIASKYDNLGYTPGVGTLFLSNSPKNILTLLVAEGVWSVLIGSDAGKSIKTKLIKCPFKMRASLNKALEKIKGTSFGLTATCIPEKIIE